ncbi:MAG: thioredoxin domain-containing protein [Bdellovibrionales bacterium]|nr:thioredoxin domain-containing protein [Oligoflexia bacterium]
MQKTSLVENNWRKWGINFLTFLLTVISFLLLKEHVLARYGNQIAKSFCDQFSEQGCRIAALSYWSEPIEHVPVSIVALSYLIAFYLSFMKSSTEALFARTLVQCVALVGSIFYVLVMTLGLGAYCPLCILFHVLNALLFLMLMRDLKPAVVRKRELLVQLIKFAGVFAAIFSVLLLIYHHYESSRFKEFGLKGAPRTEMLNSRPPHPLRNVAALLVHLGPVQAKRTLKLDMALDLTCPYCREHIINLSEALHSQNIAGEVSIVLFPLDQSCNRGSPIDHMAGSCSATRIALCASQLPEWESLFKDMMLNQAPSVDSLEDSLTARSWTPSIKAAITQCLKLQLEKKQLEDYISQLDELGLEGTPQTWLENRAWIGALTGAEWVNEIHRVLDSAPVKK